MKIRPQRFLAIALLLFSACIGKKHSDHQAPHEGTPLSPADLLRGEWRATSIDSPFSSWTNLTDYKFIVYGPRLANNRARELPGQMLIAELIGKDQTGKDVLIEDTQPVFASADTLYLGSVGSCYRLKYSATANKLLLYSEFQATHRLRLRFRKTSEDPGKPRFPQLSASWQEEPK